ncbi:hypothetical protein CAPTEDRAFT_51500, partial [Capitella teleta]
VENSYRMQPEAGERFNVTEIRKLMTELLDAGMEGHIYDQEKSPRLACLLSQTLKESAKQTICPRYKICSKVVLGESSGQGVHVVSQCLWSTDSDRFVTVTSQTKDVYAVASIN